MFLELALVEGTSVLVSGDADLLALQSQLQSLIILSPAQFHSWPLCPVSCPAARSAANLG